MSIEDPPSLASRSHRAGSRRVYSKYVIQLSPSPSPQGAYVEALMTTVEANSHREFLTYNVMRSRDRVFMSKSVYASVLPGRSETSGGPPPPSGRVRSLNTFGFRIKDSTKCSSGKCCYVESVDFAADVIPIRAIGHYINTKVFYEGLLDRLKASNFTV